MNCPKWLPRFLEHLSKSKYRNGRLRTAAILREAVNNPTDANLLAASSALGWGDLRGR
jgi:hypothetical protein